MTSVDQDNRPRLIDEVFQPDRLSKKATLISIIAAGIIGALFTQISWFLLRTVTLPAFGGSLVTRALTTATTFTLLAVTGGLLIWWAIDQRNKVTASRWRTWLTYLVAYVAPAGLVVSTLGIPLSSTRLYLDGISVDQGFRTQFLTRMTDTWLPSDMNYLDLPSYYPSLWFWLGGRYANLLGFTGWEAFQPWALISLAACCSILVPVWQRLSGSLVVATAIALVSTCLMIVSSAEEPYAGIIALGIPAAIIVCRHAIHGDRFAIAGLTIYLGVSASTYTLFTAVIALSLVALTGIFSVCVLKNWRPLLRMFIVAVGSIAIALIVWGPYFWAVITGHHISGATASHYLPTEGTLIPAPMFSASVVGVLCMVGLIYLIARSMDPDIRLMGLSLVLFYLWIVASMAATLAGFTLLGFRLDTAVALLLATAGVLAFADIRLSTIHRFYPVQFSERTSRIITITMSVVLLLGGLQYAQNIPYRLAHSIDLAHTDTDGFGQRADRYPADSAQYYSEINEHLLAKGFIPGQTVVLSDELNFMSFYPYRGFQAFTSHYANPLGEFDQRNALIEKWAKDSWDVLDTPAAFSEALAQAPWTAPEVFIFRGSTDAESQATGWNYDLAEDIYPNNPNVRFRGVKFNPAVFAQGWNTTTIGPFVVVTRA
ncbi:Arabinofuranosyltransferase N terminal/Arabinofuranosyltransferase A C terminal [Corynebacterium kutscheri]|uniref:Galactan 5-O-arabinofuranosyltransferase n=1 Tax=Corynebacterium kutscheri TaxID=35755 RepID=A0A0F6QY06_9CORY|nr:galactan 5-O-arabinofuranosyltransferase [Corynebacterium kutscheri]AKE40312.1 Arabinofuranosyltransferase N terminal/Arabinofuranosyltransferase A C terminal [Corynebacterium kutscheri]VEH05460.1 Arabinofuranosyl transferase A [Corynebacterium kutscheri]VEH10705.1 Arabinofuranosyl transferase A [Corynebacterium kutscheri]